MSNLTRRRLLRRVRVDTGTLIVELRESGCEGQRDDDQRRQTQETCGDCEQAVQYVAPSTTGRPASPPAPAAAARAGDVQRYASRPAGERQAALVLEWLNVNIDEARPFEDPRPRAAQDALGVSLRSPYRLPPRDAEPAGTTLKPPTHQRLSHPVDR